MLLPCDDTSADESVWLFWFFAKDRTGGFALGVMECRKNKAVFENLPLTAKQIFKLSLARARVRLPLEGKGRYPYLHGALARFKTAFDRSVLFRGVSPIDLSASGSLWIHNVISPHLRAYVPFSLTPTELDRDKDVKDAADGLFQTAEKEAPKLESVWAKFPSDTRALLEPLV